MSRKRRLEQHDRDILVELQRRNTSAVQARLLIKTESDFGPKYNPNSDTSKQQAAVLLDEGE
jgi:hypothetical protein